MQYLLQQYSSDAKYQSNLFCLIQQILLNHNLKNDLATTSMVEHIYHYHVNHCFELGVKFEDLQGFVSDDPQLSKVQSWPNWP